MSRQAPQDPHGDGRAAERSDGVDLSRIAEVLRDVDATDNLIAVLQRVQSLFGYLPEPVVNEIARLSGVPAARIYGIITFYAQFTSEPRGRHQVHVCHGTACHVAGAPRITQALEQELGIAEGQTTSDMAFSLESMACMGACSKARVMRVGEDTFGNLTADKTRKIIRRIMSDLGIQPRDLSAPDLAEKAAEKLGHE